MSVAAQVGLFAGGALLGGGVAYLAQRSSAKPVAVPAAPVAPVAPAAPAAPTAPAAPAAPAPSTPLSDALLLSGNPGPVDQLLQHQGYVSSYDRRLRHPNWTAEHLTAASIARRPLSLIHI